MAVDMFGNEVEEKEHHMKKFTNSLSGPEVGEAIDELVAKVAGKVTINLNDTGKRVNAQAVRDSGTVCAASGKNWQTALKNLEVRLNKRYMMVDDFVKLQ